MLARRIRAVDRRAVDRRAVDRRAVNRRVVVAATFAAIATLALGVSAAQASNATLFGPALAAQPARIPATFDRTTYRYQSTLPIAQEARLYRVIVLQSTDAAMVPALRAANPMLKSSSTRMGSSVARPIPPARRPVRTIRPSRPAILTGFSRTRTATG